MQVDLSFSDFAARHDSGAPQIITATLLGDLETPVSVFMKLAGERPNAFLLESVEGGAVRGRYSMIGLEPDLIWRSEGGKASINRRPAADVFEPITDAPLDALWRC